MVDAPELCSVIFPAIIDRDPLIVSISSGGTSPVLARFVRGKIEAVLSERFGDLAKLLESYREQIRITLPNLNERRAFVEGLLNNHVADYVLSGQLALGEELLKTQLANKTVQSEVHGISVIVVPSEVDLLTFRALRIMQQADVVLYTLDVNVSVLDLTRRDARRFEVTAELNETLLEHAQQKRVVWLAMQTPADDVLAELKASGLLLSVN